MSPSLEEPDVQEAIEVRAEEYDNLGIPPTQARVAAMRDMGLTNKEIADELDIGQGTASGYYSKFNDKVESALELMMSTLGGSTTILAKQDWGVYNRYNAKFITAELEMTSSRVEEYTAARQTPPQGRVKVITVQTGGPSGEPDGSMRMSTQSYMSLDELADDVYRENDIGNVDEARKWYTLLSEAGGEDFADSLNPPKSHDHPSNPDHPDHEEWKIEQMGRR